MMTFIIILITFFIGFVLGAARQQVLSNINKEYLSELIDDMLEDVPHISNPKGDTLVAISSIRFWLKHNNFIIKDK